LPCLHVHHQKMLVREIAQDFKTDLALQARPASTPPTPTALAPTALNIALSSYAGREVTRLMCNSAKSSSGVGSFACVCGLNFSYTSVVGVASSAAALWSYIGAL